MTLEFRVFPVLRYFTVAVVWLGLCGATALGAPDLSGRRIDIDWYRPDDQGGGKFRSQQLVFEQAKPGSPVKGILLNPTDGDLRWCASQQFQATEMVGKYTGNQIEIRLCRGIYMGVLLDVGSPSSVTGFWVMGMSGTGRIRGKCLDCGLRTPLGWDKIAVLLLLFLFVLWAIHESQQTSQPKTQSSPTPEDPKDPWHGLRNRE